MEWNVKSCLPEDEPNGQNMSAYRQPQLVGGASADAQFVFDAVYAETESCFVLTLLKVNDEWGFVEGEKRLYPQSRMRLLAEIAAFQAAPDAAFAMENEDA